MLIMGSTSQFDQRFSDTDITYSGISDPIRHDDDGGPEGGNVGPGFFRFTDGQWYSVFNSDVTGASRNARTGAIVFPSGNPRNPPDPEAQWYPQFTQDDLSEFIPSSGVPGSPTKVWRPTPDTGGDIYPTWPCTLLGPALTPPSGSNPASTR